LTIEEKFIKSISNKNIDEFIFILNDKKHHLRNLSQYIKLTIEKSSLDIFKLLINSKKINNTKMHYFSLHEASYQGRSDIVNYLLNEKKINPSYSNTAIILAAGGGHSSCIELLMNKRRIYHEPNDNFFIKFLLNKFHFYSDSNSFFLLSLFKNKIINSGCQESKPLRESCSYGHINVVKLLMKYNQSNLIIGNNYPITKAYNNGHFDIVNLLFNNIEVQKSLKIDEPELYNKLNKINVVKNKIIDF
jgi:ankyrin repeat protein